MAFSEQDRERLRLYLRKCEEMVSSSFIKNRPMELTIDLENNSNNFPEEESVRSFLMVFGSFYRQEPNHFLSICKLLSRNLNDEETKKLIGTIKDSYSRSLKGSSIAIEYDKKTYTPEEILKLYFYGNYFHHELDKRKLLKDMESVSVPIFKWEFLNLLYNLTRHIYYIGSIIKGVLDGKIK